MLLDSSTACFPGRAISREIPAFFVIERRSPKARAFISEMKSLSSKSPARWPFQKHGVSLDMTNVEFHAHTRTFTIVAVYTTRTRCIYAADSSGYKNIHRLMHEAGPHVPGVNIGGERLRHVSESPIFIISRSVCVLIIIIYRGTELRSRVYVAPTLLEHEPNSSDGKLIFLHHNRLPMGSHISPLLAEIFMSTFENKIFTSRKPSYKLHPLLG